MSGTKNELSYSGGIDSIGEIFVHPLKDGGLRIRDIVFGAVLPVVFLLTGWIFFLYIWFQFIVSASAIGSYQLDPMTLLVASGLFIYMTHFWSMLSWSIMKGIGGPDVVNSQECPQPCVEPVRKETDRMGINFTDPVSGRFDRPIGRGH